jgi:RimJ/RimL family protein N-acetyltransferase/acyl carrier protein
MATILPTQDASGGRRSERMGAELSLRGRHGSLRPIEPPDISALYQIELSPQNISSWRFRGGTPNPEQYSRTLFDGVLVSFIVEDSTTRQIAGIVTCYNADLKNGVAYVGALSAESHRRTPVVLEGLELLIEYCFQNWQLRKLYFESPGYSYVDFASAWPWLLREEGRLRDHEYHADRFWDRLILAMHRADWNRYKTRHSQSVDPRTPDEFVALLRTELLVPDDDDVTLYANLVNDLGYDSLSLFLLVVFVEELVNETVPAPLVAQWKTLEDAYVWLTARQHR